MFHAHLSNKNGEIYKIMIYLLFYMDVKLGTLTLKRTKIEVVLEESADMEEVRHANKILIRKS